jgi:hypothetical protein
MLNLCHLSTEDMTVIEMSCVSPHELWHRDMSSVANGMKLFITYLPETSVIQGQSQYTDHEKVFAEAPSLPTD